MMGMMSVQCSSYYKKIFVIAGTVLSERVTLMLMLVTIFVMLMCRHGDDRFFIDNEITDDSENCFSDKRKDADNVLVTRVGY